MSLVRLILNSNGTALDFTSQSPLAVGSHVALNNFTAYVDGVNGGEQAGGLFAFLVGAVQASATFTFASTGPTNGQTCTIAGVTFTAKTNGATLNEFNISSTPATVAANLALAINAAPSMVGIATATSALGVTTITAVVPGLIGNGLVTANVNLSNTTVVSFAGGLDGTAYNIDLR